MLKTLLTIAFCLLAITSLALAEEQETPAALVNLVRQDCGSCHGMTLKGGLGPDIRPDALLGVMVTAAWGSGLAGWREGLRGWGHGAAVLGAMLVHPLGVVLVLPLALLYPHKRWLLLAPLGLLGLLWLRRRLLRVQSAVLAGQGR